MASAADGELILKLYELRTEPCMREARKFVAGFNPASFEEMIAVQRDAGSQNNAYWRQAMSYWEMAAALVLHGSLDAGLFVDSNGEPFFLYAKFAAFHEEWKKTTGVAFMRQTGILIEKNLAAKEKYDGFVKRMAKA